MATVAALAQAMTLARYFARTLLAHMGLVLGAFLALVAVFHFIDQLNDVGTGAYSTAAAVLHTVLLLPTWVLDFAPVAVFIGTLSGLGRLHQDSEITVARAAGWSLTQLAIVVVAAAASLAAAAALLGEFVAPGLAQTANRMKAELRYGPGAAQSGSAWWTRESERLIGIDRRADLPAVTIVELYSSGRIAAIAEARSVRAGAAGALQLVDYRESRFDGAAVRAARSMTRVETSPAVRSLLRLSDSVQRFASLRQRARLREQLR
ncbi:MAG: LptF/LptG family permease, partial [Steroidobacteraceae bacterium]|nr:LptF/LptG family permease [Steroidobacteraceae bacterium]